MKRIVCQLPSKLKVKQFDGKHLLDGMELKYGWDDVEVYGIPETLFLKAPGSLGFACLGLVLVPKNAYVAYLDNGRMTAYPEEIVKYYYLEVL